jgi:ATP-dependent protease HslVU (ClpYQ) peptidase subunit
MTTLACDGHWLAADGLVTTEAGTVVEFDAAKIVRLKDGSLLAAAGDYHALEALRACLDGEKDEVGICDGTWEAVRLMLDGSGLYYCDKHPSFGIGCTWPAALGSGGEIALGAMLAGATPKKAVEIAARRNIETGGTIRCESIG